MTQRSQPFALEISSQGAPVLLLQALASQVFSHVACTTVPVDELAAALTTATTGESFGGARRCDLQLRSRGGSLEILVSANGGRIWQASCALVQAPADD